MESHPFRREPVDPALGLGEEAEGGERTALDPLRQARALEETPYVREAAVGVLLGVLHRKPERSDAVDLGGLRTKREREPELTELYREPLGGGSRVEQGGEGHVAGGAADGLEVGVLGERPGPLSPGRGRPR